MRAFRGLATAGLVVLSGTLAGCDLFTQSCTLNLVFGLTLYVRDSVSGAPAAQDATATLRDGDYLETMQGIPLDDLILVGAGERAGEYTIQVTKAGYTPWTRTRVRVEDDGCHVRNVQIDVRLQPLST